MKKKKTHAHITRNNSRFRNNRQQKIEEMQYIDRMTRHKVHKSIKTIIKRTEYVGDQGRD